MTRIEHHNHDAEQVVIGAVLLAPDLLSQLRQRLAPDDFHDPRHTLIWQAICTMADLKQPVDAVLLSERLNQASQLSKVGGAPYLHTMMNAVPAIPMTSHYADIVSQHADRRKTIAVAERLTQLATAGADTAVIVAALQNAADDIAVRAVTTPETGRAVKLTQASDIEMQPVLWTWDDRIPSGALTLVPGREGIGKSLFLAWLTAQITRGTLPGCHFGQPRAVIYAATEDSWSQTVVPRLHAAGADLTMVYQVEVESDGHTDTLTLPVDCERLALEIERLGVALLAADPLLSLISSNIDTHRDRDLRTALEPLVRMADQTGCAVVGLAHFNKSANTDALNLVTGSRAFTAIARAVIAVAKDDEAGDGSCVMSQEKNNLGRNNLTSLRYIKENAEIPTAKGVANTGRLVFIGESDVSVGDILCRQGSSDFSGREDRDDAQAWLVDFLIANGGEAAKKDVLKAAKTEGISDSALRRARERARVESDREGFPSVAIWKLTLSDRPRTDGPVVSQSRQSGQLSGRDTTGTTGTTAHTQSPQEDLLTGVMA